MSSRGLKGRGDLKLSSREISKQSRTLRGFLAEAISIPFFFCLKNLIYYAIFNKLLFLYAPVAQGTERRSPEPFLTFF
jgi:hypothetical protein